uniref:Uncharacterized protein n=1 Tax=Ralstonia solanacearum TaxID=305 RepID=A0A0S4WAW2_RALSL|nr:protein of unknown function [Ralstonia solanacearum]CUV53327.1 protein of unknown function [Ralstonia solanacearum]
MRLFCWGDAGVGSPSLRAKLVAPSALPLTQARKLRSKRLAAGQLSRRHRSGVHYGTARVPDWQTRNTGDNLLANRNLARRDNVRSPPTSSDVSRHSNTSGLCATYCAVVAPSRLLNRHNPA